MPKSKSIHPTINKRIFELADYAVSSGISNSVSEFLRNIGAIDSNKSKYITGSVTFTHDQVYQAIKLTGSSLDYVYGFVKHMKGEYSVEKKTPLQRIKEAVAELEGKGKRYP